MEGSKTSFIFSDPPYNIGLDYSKGISTEGKYKGSFSASKDKKSSPAYKAFIDAAKERLGRGDQRRPCFLLVRREFRGQDAGDI
jgi:hypothetical protein